MSDESDSMRMVGLAGRAGRFRAALALSTLMVNAVLAADAPVNQTPTSAAKGASTAPLADPAPPPSAPPKLGAAELEKLLMPIALYPDALIATLLPASVYPLEIVQAVRFLSDTNNMSKIDQQPWDESVKAIAKIPAALKKMNDDLQWTIQLGEAFLNQDKDVMDTIQSLRSKAQKAGTLRTTEQQIVVVTNMVVEKTVEQQVVVVTNTVVQIQPSNPQVVYVPTYPPTVYYPPPAYVYDPYAPLVTFAAGVAVGAIIANNCDWGHGGCYWGGGGDVDINNNVNIDRGDRTVNRGDRNTAIGSGNRNQVNPQGGNRGQKWQPDQSRVRSSGSSASAKTMESRGWGSGGQGGAGSARPGTQPAGGNRPGGGATASTRPATGNRPSGGPSASTQPARPSGGASAANRPSSSPSVSARPASTGGGGYPGGGNGNRSVGATPSAGTSDRGGAGARSSASPSPSSTRSGSSAFSGGGGGASAGSRGAASRSGGGGGGGRGGGGGGRGGGGRR